MALAVLIFSGIWPYVKLGTMMACWLAPPRILRLAMRQRLLEIMDAFGKWSLLDTFFYCTLMVAFKFHITTRDNKILQPLFPNSAQEASLQVFVNPTQGFY